MYPHRRGPQTDDAQARHLGGMQPVGGMQLAGRMQAAGMQLQRSSHMVEAALAKHPHIHSALDDSALLCVQNADPARAVEIIEELAAKSDVKNPSAFVSRALNSYPQRRGRKDEVEQTLAQNPELRSRLDEAAVMKLKEAEPARALEIIQDLITKSDVRNPSAFIASSLNKYPNVRGGSMEFPSLAPKMPLWTPPVGHYGVAGRLGPPTPAAVYAPVSYGVPATRPFASMAAQRMPVAHTGGRPVAKQPLDRLLAQHPWIALDDTALNRLYSADLDRAIEIVQDMAAKGNVRNPSAFVSQALTAFPKKRSNPMDLEQALARRPAIAQALDARALQQLREADPARAVEIIEDVAASATVRNPSAFIAKALTTHPLKRGIEEVAGAPAQSLPPLANPKRFRDNAAVGGAAVQGLGHNHMLDEQAQKRLNEADPDRAAEVLQELNDKGAEIRNPSAFVAKALTQYPHFRGRRPT